MYDLIILGLGPAGLAASIYASRYRIKHLAVGELPGGTLTVIPQVENYPGFQKISGLALTKRLVDQAKSLGGEIKVASLAAIGRQGQTFQVKTKTGETLTAKTLIMATGMERRKLGVPGEVKYLGAGVSYCATCDAAFFKGKTVAVAGGSNAAVMSVLHLVEFAAKIYLIYRGEALRAEPIWIERVLANPKVEVVYQTNIAEILGDGKKVTGVRLAKSYQGKEQITLDGIFVEIGGVPVVALAKPLGVALDDKGFIKVAPDMTTNVPGLFAAGDIASVFGEMQQIVVAVAEGALAALSVFQYLKGHVEKNG